MNKKGTIQPLQKSLRIGLDAKRAFNNGTGLGNYARFVIAGLVKYFPQHTYYLFTPTVDPQFAEFVTLNDNVQLVTPESILGKTFSSFWRTYAIADMCNELKLDVFHGLSNELPQGIEKFEGNKLVTIHDLIFLRYPNYYGNIDRYIYTKKFKHACKWADTILATSHQTQQDIIAYFGTDETKIKIGFQNCDVRFESLILPQQKEIVAQRYGIRLPFILSVGTIEQRKNQLMILKAYKKLNDPSIQLVFVGKQTAYAQELHDFIETNELFGQVTFLSQVPVQDLPALYQQASLFVYVSEFEGFGIPILEAMRSNIPIIAANTSSLTEVGGKMIEYVNLDEDHKLAELMVSQMNKTLESGYYAEQLTLFETEKLITELEANYQLGVSHNKGVY